ncbi:MAG: hypothetical protein NTW12_08785 [Deltaproteobacteria bacterium]|nr:hypothetical protein [Deltaproteobacteria bacterium]
MRKKELYLVCLAVFPFMICTGIVYSIISIYMAEIGLTKSQIGFLYTSGATAGAISSPFAGTIADLRPYPCVFFRPCKNKAIVRYLVLFVFIVSLTYRYHCSYSYIKK